MKSWNKYDGNTHSYLCGSPGELACWALKHSNWVQTCHRKLTILKWHESSALCVCVCVSHVSPAQHGGLITAAWVCVCVWCVCVCVCVCVCGWASVPCKETQPPKSSSPGTEALSSACLSWAPGGLSLYHTNTHTFFVHPAGADCELSI